MKTFAKIKFYFIKTGLILLLKIIIKIFAIIIYVKLVIAIVSIGYPKSIIIPKSAVPKAVEKTIIDVVKALIDPKCFTP